MDLNKLISSQIVKKITNTNMVGRLNNSNLGRLYATFRVKIK